MPEDRCVYCWPNKPAKVPYTAEHVVPEAFGNFKRNLVLNQGVCGECNQFFGNGIDRLIGRGSAEAIRRLDLRIKPAGEVGDVLYDRIDVSLSTNNELDGLKMELGNEQGELVVLLVHQVRFRMQDGGGHIYVTEKELEDASKPLPKGIDVNGEIALVFDTDTAQERLIELLASRDIKPEKTLRKRG